MIDQNAFNWVERKHAAAQRLSEGQLGLWRDLCMALTDACRSFNKLYGGKTETSSINGHQFWITLAGDRKRDIDIDFDDQASSISVAYDSSIAWGQQSFSIKADFRRAFLADNTDKHVTPDEASAMILTQCFFPSE